MSGNKTSVLVCWRRLLRSMCECGRRLPNDLVLVAFALVICTSERTVFAGAGSTAWNGIGFTLGNGTFNDADKAQLQPLIDQLMKPVDATTPFGPDAGLGLTAKQALARVMQIRANVQKMIDLAKKRGSAARADFLQKQMDNGKVCVSWGMSARGTCLIDHGTEKKESEKILIWAQGVVNGDLPLYSPEIVSRSATIAHENTHAGQSYAHTLPADPPPTPEQERAGTGRQYACNEVEAHGNNETWKKALKDALNVPAYLDPDTPLPDGLDPAIVDILNSIRALNNAAAIAAAADPLRNAMCNESDGDKLAKECYTEAKNAFNDFINGTITQEQLKNRLNDNRWKHYTGWLDHPSFVSEMVPSTITQMSNAAGAGPAIATGLVQIMDFEVLPLSPIDNALLVIGKNGGGNGELQVYFHPGPSNPFFSQATKQILINNDPRLRQNMEIIHDPQSNAYFVYDGESRLIYPLIDTNFDGVPNQLAPAPINPPAPELGSYTQFHFDVGASVPTIIGHELVDLLEPGMPAEQLLIVLKDTNTDGFFESVAEVAIDDYVQWEPAIVASTLLAGSNSLSVFGMPGAVLQVWVTDNSGNLLALKGAGTGQGIAAGVSVSLSSPFMLGEQAVVVDVTNGRRSSNAVVSATVPAASTWSMIVMGLALLCAGTLVVRHGRRVRVG